MDEPVRSRLRPTRHRGLTSPDPVTALPGPHGRQSPAANPSHQDKPHKRERQDKHAQISPEETHPPGTAHPERSSEFTRWIEA